MKKISGGSKIANYWLPIALIVVAAAGLVFGVLMTNQSMREAGQPHPTQLGQPQDNSGALGDGGPFKH